LDHQLIQQGYTILEEAVITEVCKTIEIDAYERENRDFVSSLLQQTAKKSPPQNWKGALGKMREKGVEVQRNGGNVFKILSERFDFLAKGRNDINHCGTISNSRNEKKLIEHLEKTFREIRDSLELFKKQV